MHLFIFVSHLSQNTDDSSPLIANFDCHHLLWSSCPHCRGGWNLVSIRVIDHVFVFEIIAIISHLFLHRRKQTHRRFMRLDFHAGPSIGHYLKYRVGFKCALRFIFFILYPQYVVLVSNMSIFSQY